MSHTWVTASDGVRLSVRVTGSDDVPTIVAVHGYPDNSSMWDGVVTEFVDRYRVVVYDVRGAGESDKPKGRRAYRLDQLAEDLAAVVNEVSPDRKVHLLAHDWGSIQTWHAVTGEWLRGRIASYTSISGPSLDYAGQWFRAQLRPSPRRLRHALTQLVHSGYIAFFQVPFVADLAWRSGLASRVISVWSLLRPHRSRPTACMGCSSTARICCQG